MAAYHRLSLTEREELSRLLATGASLRAAGRALARAPSTLARELARQPASPRTYRAVPAHQRARTTRQSGIPSPKSSREAAITP